MGLLATILQNILLIEPSGNIVIMVLVIFD